MIGVLVGFGVATVGAWLLERWRYRRQLLHGEPVAIPLWIIPLTVLLALGLIWTGVILSSFQHQAGVVLERAEYEQLRGLITIQDMDSILVKYLGVTGP